MYSRTNMLWTHRRNLLNVLNMRKLSSLLDIKPEVHDAIINKRAVVALESTIITHGMPYPHNLKTAMEVEEIVREQGAIPATIAILDGKIKIGLSRNELEHLADAKTNVIKTSRRDLAYVLSQRLNGGTTVAGTLICADLCGIKVFATGGIGGVHRDGENTLDISADLMELGKSSVTVVSSGIKSILDIPRTIEYLETQGVCVTTFQCPDKEFPAFYSRTSGVKAQYDFNDAVDAAMCINKSIQLGLKSSILIGNPVPNEFAMDGLIINNAIEKALRDADESGIKGKDVTPYLLAAIAKITSGKSLQTNIALIKENARVAAQIAVELEKLQNNGAYGHEKMKITSEAANNIKPERMSPLVVGGSVLDIHYHVDEEDLKLNGATYKAITTFSPGGVARNIAEGLNKLNCTTTFVSAFGDDQNGEILRKTLPSDATHSSKVSSNVATASCAVILDRNRDCKIYVGDMDIHREITPDLIYANVDLIKHAPIVCIDANLSHETIDAILLLAARYNKPVFYEPTDMLIADKPFQLNPQQYRQIKFMTPNIYELRKIATTLHPSTATAHDNNDLRVNEIAELCDKLHHDIDNIIVTAGSQGIFIKRFGTSSEKFFANDFGYNRGNGASHKLRHYPATIEANVKSSSGAGDAFCAGFIAAMLRQKTEAICVSVGFEAAHASLRSVNAVPKEFFNENHICWNNEAKFNVC